MKLPRNIYHAIKDPFAHHGCWHAMRSPSIPKAVRERCFPGLIAFDEPGCGEQFLTFHRHMIRHFKWYTLNTLGPRYDYRPWNEPPAWITGVLDAWMPSYRSAILNQVEQFVKFDSLDHLGRFIEGTGGHDLPGIHGVLHAVISGYEELNFGSQPLSDMGSQFTAPYNEHFWGLHGWIDSFYQRWQELRGDPVDVSPVRPHISEPLCPECSTLNPKMLALNPSAWFIDLLGKQKNE